jgi:hypothetical protein
MFRLLVEGGLLVEVEVADVARSWRRRAKSDEASVARSAVRRSSQSLLGPLQRVERRAHVSGEAEHVLRDAELRRLERRRRDALLSGR